MTTKYKPRGYIETKGMSEIERKGFFHGLSGEHLIDFSGDAADWEEFRRGSAVGHEAREKRERRAYQQPAAVYERAVAKEEAEERTIKDAPGVLAAAAAIPPLDLTVPLAAPGVDALWNQRKARSQVVDQMREVARAHEAAASACYINVPSRHRLALSSEQMREFDATYAKLAREIEQIDNERQRRSIEAHGGPEAHRAEVAAQRAERKERRRIHREHRVW